MCLLLEPENTAFCEDVCAAWGGPVIEVNTQAAKNLNSETRLLGDEHSLHKKELLILFPSVNDTFLELI